MTERVTGIGGVFFKAREPQALLDWYAQHLGVPAATDYVGATFRWREHADPAREAYTIWSVFPDTTKYFDPSPASFMLNYRVDDLDAMLRQLREAGAAVDDRIEDSEFGRFGWATDPEGNRFELWQPPEKLP